MATRIRTLNFLPEIFKTPTNTQFLQATLDQIVDQPKLQKIEGYIGSKLGYGINAKDKYVTEPTKIRTDYQLDPGVVFLKSNTGTAQDFISYPGIVDALKLEGGLTNDNNRLFNSQFYSWDSFTDLDKIINFNQYYWLPNGAPPVSVGTDAVYNNTDYIVENAVNGYNIFVENSNTGTINPALTLLRGGTYTFTVNQHSNFWIQGEPGLTGYSATQPNIQTRDVYGVENNGAEIGTVIFTVPRKSAQDNYNFPGNNPVGVVSTLPFSQINGALLSDLGGIDGITSLNGLTVMFYGTGIAEEQGFVSAFYDSTQFDQSGGNPYVYPGTSADDINFEGGYYTDVNSTFYQIVYVGDISNPIIKLVPAGLIPINEKIIPQHGVQWLNRVFFRNSSGYIDIIPYISAILDTLYYQDGTSANKVGIIKLIDSNITNSLDITGDILGKKTYTAPNGVVFTNGLKVIFSGDIYPTSYNNNQYYVEGVGTAIELVPVTDMIAPELFSAGSYIPYDTTPYDITNYDSNLYVPLTPDYITIARNAINKNAWSRSNRWFHIDVINATALYNNNQDIVSLYATQNNKAKRPIIEFYPNIKMFNSGIIGKKPIDFIDFRTPDAFSLIAGQENYYPDVEFYSDYTASFSGVSGPITDVDVTDTEFGSNYITLGTTSTTGWHVNDTLIFSSGASFGGLVLTSPIPTIYYIQSIVDSQRFTVSTQRNGEVVQLSTGTGSLIGDLMPYSTDITIQATETHGPLQVGQYITDSTNMLPTNSYVTAISGTTTLTITASWNNESTFSDASDASLIATDTTNDNYALFDGARVVFAADTDSQVRNKIYVSRFSTISGSSTPVITLTEAEDGAVLENEQTVTYRGYNYIGQNFFFIDTGLVPSHWRSGQQKKTTNQAPLFDILDSKGISLGDTEHYVGTSFAGTKLFAYGMGSGLDDSILGFPIRYSSVDNVGDISFDVSLNTDIFNYVQETTPITEKINTGYVFNYSSLTSYVRALGWQPAIAPSVQYQTFEFNYLAEAPTSVYECDVAMIVPNADSWPTIKVYLNNVLQSNEAYTVTITETSTTVGFVNPAPLIDNVIQILLLSDQVSTTAYYTIPGNLNNNPLNADVTAVNIGDIRGQYQSIFYNSPDSTGEVFGSNNIRDLGNTVPYGSTIIQNSASLILPAAFLRKQNHNLFNALLFNSREYINFKTLLVDTINNTEYSIYQSPSDILDDALDQITSTKTDSNSFFWSDMLPSKAAYITNTYLFGNSLDTSIYPLSRTYDFAKATYYGVLVYLSRTVEGLTQIIQLTRGVDYSVSADSPSLTITFDLLPGDQMYIKEYNQTYGSYVPNTPTKLGLYPSTIPSVTLDTAYKTPTYFIVGHDGSYTKLYGSYNPATGKLIDFRDQALLEFEKRVYNNLKISATVPIKEYEVLPGFFRDTGYTYSEILQIYSESFLNWVGQNRIDYKTQFYDASNQYTYNYGQSSNKIDNTEIEQGYWRGIYEYFYDTSNPDTAPWEMLGFTNQPTWWATRYGAAPYTSENLVLWGDLAQGINWNDGTPVVITQAIRPELLQVLPVDTAGNLVSPFISIVGNYVNQTFNHDWKVGDAGPVEFSYRRSSSYPFDLMRILALTKPAEFFNLAVDVDNYKYNEEFNQYLVNDRSHLVISDVEIYGSGTAKTSYVNWIVDFEKQFGIDATQSISDLLDNLDVRLVYRLAGFSDKNMLKFYVEKGTPNSNNSSLLIPDESYSVLLYDNQPFNRIVYSSVIVQTVTGGGFKVFGNSQTNAYFTITKPKINGSYTRVEIDNLKVNVAKDYYDSTVVVPYGTEFRTVQEVAQFLESYGRYLKSQGVRFDKIENGIEITWTQMVAEFLYWAQTGWEVGSIININPSATLFTINKDSNIVQPLTLRQQNFVLNQNLYPIQSIDLSVIRDGTLFSVEPLNLGDTISYGTFNISNIEHGIVFDNVTVFNDVIYNLTTGLRQDRIVLRGNKTAEWNGTIDAQGFILNQDNIVEWSKDTKYTTGQIVKYKNKYWIAITIIQAKELFDETDWKQTDYNEVQKGLLPNSSTRSYESTLYYDVNRANLEKDADLLSFSLIGYRPRDYMAVADLTDITQINVYKNMIKNKGTKNAANAFKGATLSQGGIDYNIYENWAIKSGEFGGVLNSNFVEFRLHESELTGNPAIVGLTNGIYTAGVQQEVPIYSLFNYGKVVTDPNVLPTLGVDTPSMLYPDAGYVNFNDVKMSSYFYSGMSTAVDSAGIAVPLNELYVRDYVWIANQLGTWQVYTPVTISQVVSVVNNRNGTCSVTFDKAHGLTKYQPIAIVNFNDNVNGYYIAASIVNQNSITVNLNLNPTIPSITGNGIGFKFQTQRVTTPADINNLPLLDSEFIKNTVWVDTNVDGNWAVYRKSINYSHVPEITKTASLSFGTAVAFTDQLGYLVSDADLGEVYRYTYNSLTGTYLIDQTISEASSFGTSISYSDDIFVISQPTNYVFVYRLINTILVNKLELQDTISAPEGSGNWGNATALSGDKNWLYISDTDNNLVHAYRKSAVTGYYEAAYIVDGDDLALSTSGDMFGSSLSTDYYGDTLVVGCPNRDFNSTTDNWGYTYVFDRSVQNFEMAYTSIPSLPQTFPLTWTPSTEVQLAYATTGIANVITMQSPGIYPLADYVNFPVVFSGNILENCGLLADKVYYIVTVLSDTQFIVSEERGGSPVVLNDKFVTTDFMTVTVQTTPIFVSVNGTSLADNDYSVMGSTLNVISPLTAGDIINVSGGSFALVQTLTTEHTPRVGVHFGQSVDTTTYASEILVGAPFELSTQQQEGAVYRYTNGGGKYGTIIGTTPCNVTSSFTILLNGYAVAVPIGNATDVAARINVTNITNISASATTDNKLVIQLVNNELATPNNKLSLTVITDGSLAQLGVTVYTQTQVINDPHIGGTTQFGSVVKFNEFGSFVASAPTGTRFEATTFDFIDDETDNDTVFDNNTTQWVDSCRNAGAVYMYDYLPVYNESLYNIGEYTYAQSVNDTNIDFGSQPMYGQALDFNNYNVVIGTPNFKPDYVNGQVTVYTNALGVQDWSVYRTSGPVVDTSRIQDIQLFSALTNMTLDNVDYMDPLQGKLLGAIRDNIDVVSNNDPASYNSTGSGSIVWGADKVGQLWFNTTNTRFVNYHQNDVVYNSKYWGNVFPGSDVSIYSWISSTVPPLQYAGTGTPYDIASYTAEQFLDAAGQLVLQYFYWVRNTNVIFTETGKTLSDTVLQYYITYPQQTGISYFAPLTSGAFALYNSGENINANDTVLHIGYSTGTNDDVSHNQFSLIRSDYADDFLPGLPGTNSQDVPESLYDRMLDSMCGVDESGAVVPNPYLPKLVQTGILARPRQSFFYNRFAALKNYLTYANEILSLYPIAESRPSFFLNTQGEINPSTPAPFYDTGAYWDYVNWWATGYDNNTKSALQVKIYADLSTIAATAGLIVTVQSNGDGKSETYVYDEFGTWNRIGLQSGTIAFNSALWDYETYRLGFGDNFFDTAVYDVYPSAETRLIVRALNEEIYTNELLIHRNKSLILLFEYIQSETVESQNYLPWLNKTSFMDVSHTIRELLPINVFQSDNQDFLTGYLNEIKPYHVVIKEFLFKYTGNNVYGGNITDFDLPAQYDTSVDQFISPNLVYSNPSAENDFLNTDSIWQTQPYAEWYNNHGLSLTGVNNYQITTIASYMAMNSSTVAVNNPFGFPVNGTFKLYNPADDSKYEIIGYSYVDRALGILGGLTRGIDGSEIAIHFPGEKVYIDLPAVLLLDAGRAYAEKPRVTAYIDTTIYPAPTREAVLEAVMNLNSLLSINVIDPGQGYAVLPEIVIDPSISLPFGSTSVYPLSSTIEVSKPWFKTGDLIKYECGVNTVAPSGLDSGQYYYVKIVESLPANIIALYTNYADSLNDIHRVTFYDTGSGNNNYLLLSARASCVTSALPIRENQITIKFDRTSYNSRLTDWQTSAFYGSFFAGDLQRGATIASSSVLIDSSLPPISRVLASSQGAVFEIEDVTSSQVVTWSSRTRNVTRTVESPANLVRLIPSDGGAPYEGFVGPTLGFYVGMPVKFEGATLGTDPLNPSIQVESGLENYITYYVGSVENDSDVTLVDEFGTPIDLADCNISVAGLLCFIGQTVDRTYVTIDYPGIATATATNAGTNEITIPMTPGGNAGTDGYYTGLPVYFVGDVFGNIIENDPYYVTSVVDKEHITVSKNEHPIILAVTAVETSTDILSCYSTLQLSINDPVIFSDIIVNGVTTTKFDLIGSISSGVIYYVSAIYPGTGNTTFSVSATVNGADITLTGVSGPRICTLTNQKDTLSLVTAAGAMTINAGLPISPGQINGQKLTFYPTSGQYSNLGGTISNLQTRVVAAVADNRLSVMAASNGLSNIYINMPLRVDQDYYNLDAGTTYYVLEMGTVTTEINETVGSTGELKCNTGFYTTGFYVGMPIIFGTQSMGGISLNVKYYVWSVVDDTTFTISTAEHRDEQLPLFSTLGLMTATGETYIVLTGSVGSTSPIVIPSDPNLPLMGTFTQYPDPEESAFAVFDISYQRGGYSAIVTFTSSGYAVDNIITINGTLLGGTSPENDVILTVDAVGFTTTALAADAATNAITCITTDGLTVNDPVIFSGTAFSNIEVGVVYYIESITDGVSFTLSESLYGPVYSLDNDTGLMTVTDSGIGSILSVIVSGTPNETVTPYYVKVISASVCEVFTDPLLTIPVNIDTFSFKGITSTTAIQTFEGTESESNVVVEDISGFSENDPVVFTGEVFGGIELGRVYYVSLIDYGTNTLTIVTTIGDTSTFALLSDATGACTMAKAGDFALLPEPFYFDQSVVRYNNRIYQCLISNNDSEFIFGKWELLDNGDPRLNALDRIFGYYQPTVNMPGLDMAQLVNGITYPNSTYQGNAFAPADEFPLDILLRDQPFYPSEVDVTAVVWDGTQYLMSSDTPDYSAVIKGLSGSEWKIDKIATQSIQTTDIVYNKVSDNERHYIITTNNRTTPILVSPDGVTWSTSGEYTPYGTSPFDELPYDTTSLSVASVSLNSIAYYRGYYVAVGENIVRSTDTYSWNETYTFVNLDPRVTLVNKFNGISSFDLPGFSGFVAVGGGQQAVYPTGSLSAVIDINLLMVSGDGVSWGTTAGYTTLTSYALNAATSNGTVILVVGDNSVRFISPGTNWLSYSAFTPVAVKYTYQSNNLITVLDVSTLSPGDAIQFAGITFGNIVAGTVYYVDTIPLAFSSTVTATTSGTNEITCGDTTGLWADRPITFTGTLIGGLNNDMIYYVSAITSGTNFTVTTAPGGSVFGLITDFGSCEVASIPALTISETLDGPTFDLVDGSSTSIACTVSRVFANLNDVTYAEAHGMFVAVGDAGTIETSPDGITWTTCVSNTTQNLHGVECNTTNTELIVVGDNNTILLSTDGITWTSSALFVPDPIDYVVQGDPFMSGYGPEEMVPGIVSDNLTMTVTTRPGTNWPAIEFAYVGYNVVSLEIAPTSATQVVYNFNNAVQTPIQISVYVIDRATGLSRALYSGVDYELFNGLTDLTTESYEVLLTESSETLLSESSITTRNAAVGWMTRTLQLNTPLDFITVGDSDILRIDVYEVGNGDQLVRSNTQNNPFMHSPVTGFCEVALNCNYSAALYSGSGVVRPGTEPIQTVAYGTDATYNTISCVDVLHIILNGPITFHGATFGNLVEDAVYYVKSISISTGTITVSDTLVSGMAGDTFALTTDSGSVVLLIQSSAIQAWSTPIVYHNGAPLQFGISSLVTSTSTGTDTVTCNSTAGLTPGCRLVFSNTMFGVVAPNRPYYVESIVDNNRFTISESIGGSRLPLTNAFGGATLLSNDYTFGIGDNGISAKLIFATTYDQDMDYITYAVFGETIPAQYGYTVPETQMLQGDGSTIDFLLTHYVGGDNPTNAVVEMNGLRLSNTEYVIDPSTNLLSFFTVPAITDLIAVTSYNLTDRQYLHTEYQINTVLGNRKTVANIVNIDNSITAPLAITNTTSITGGVFTCDSTIGFLEDQTVIFKGTAFGNVGVNGQVYYVLSIPSGTSFIVSETPGGAVAPVSDAIGTMMVIVGGTPAVRVTTGIPHDLAENDLVRIDGTQGSYQLNNNTYYAKLITDYVFDLYMTPYVSEIDGSNNPVTSISSYSGSGYVWLDKTFTLLTTTATSTAAATNRVVCLDTSALVEGTPIIFSGTTFGGIVEGTTYYVGVVYSPTEFSVSSSQTGSVFVLTNGPITPGETMGVTQWEQTNVDRLWVTVNGMRVPSSSLRINTDNNLSILTTIVPLVDEIIITNMIPSATPNELIYMQHVNKNNMGSAYRANTQTRTWLTGVLHDIDEVIYVNDISRITNVIVQNVVAPTTAPDGSITIGLTADKRIISQVIIRNVTAGITLGADSFSVTTENIVPVVLITDQVTSGDALMITTIEGNTIYVDGEQIRFSTVNFETNTLTGLQRGANGTGERSIIPAYTEVYGILSTNRLTDVEYAATWNNSGIPLQISNTPEANFLMSYVS